MKLLTKANLKALPELYAQDGKGDEAIIHVKFFTPDSSFTWYVTEYNPDEGMFFGLVDNGLDKELGYFSLQQLSSLRGKLGLPVERDRHFRPATVGEVKRGEVR